MENLLSLCKESLSIVSTVTLKDKEIKMWIQSGVADLVRQGIDASEDTGDSLIQSAIVMFVKGNFGNVDIKEKELAQKTYSRLCNNLSLSEKYKTKENENA